MFGLFAVFGYVTKIDLTRIGSIALMLVLGLILASIVNLFFLHSTMFDLIISYALVVLFCGVTAYDIQKIKAMSQHAYDEETGTKLAIFGALMLYLDFIIIFKNLLRILSRD
jgi:FtsH-binding integral membrane protein